MTDYENPSDFSNSGQTFKKKYDISDLLARWSELPCLI